MKKFSLLLCCFVALLMSQKVWATSSVDVTGTTLTVNSDEPGYLAGVEKTSAMKACTKIVLIGKFNASDLQSLKQNTTEGSEAFNAVTEVDLSQAKFISSAGSSNPKLYKNALTSYDPAPWAENGMLAYFGVSDNLYQCNVATTKSWTSLGSTSLTSADKTYSSEEIMNADKDNRSEGQIGRYPNDYMYCQVIDNISSDLQRKTGVDITNSAYATDVNNAITDKLNSADDVFTKTMYVYFRLVESNGTWNWAFQGVFDALKTDSELAYDDNGETKHYVDYNGDPDGVGANINDLVIANWMHNNYIHFTYVYSKTNNWQKISGQDISNGQSFKNAFNSAVAKKLYSLESGTTNKELVVYFQSRKNNDDNNYHWEYLGVFDEGTHPYASLGEGQQDYNGNPNGVNAVNADINYLVEPNGHKNNYIHFNYTFNKNAWGTPQSEEPSGVSYINIADFDVNDRNEHLGSYSAGAWVKMYSSYDYYRLTQTTERRWNSVTFYESAEYAISYNFTAAELAANPTAQDGEYAVVDATLMQRHGTEWSVDITESYDWKQMRFTIMNGDQPSENPLWSSLQSVVLPDGIYASDLCDNKFWPTNGGSITRVQSGTTVATINTENDRTAVLNVPYSTDEGTEFRRMKDILWKDGCVKGTDDSYTSSVVEGFHSGTYAVTAAFDASTINNFNNGTISVLDLRYVTLDTDNDGTVEEEEIIAFKSELGNLSNSTIEYIILPAGMDKDFVCDKSLYYTTEGGVITETKKMSSLKGVISSSSTDLVAYMTEYGNLAEARCLATGNDNPTVGFFPTVQGLNKVTLGGKLNEDDISTTNQDGKGLQGEKGTITSIDVEKAIYYSERVETTVEGEGGESTTTVSYNVTGEIMNFNAAGFMNSSSDDNSTMLSEIILPTDPSMNTIPNGGFTNLKKLTSICVPYNYTWIKNDAFLGSCVNHITTTDDYNGALIDNGPLSYTFSTNLEQLGEKGVAGTYVFPHDMGVIEIYSLATKVPKCYDHVFPENINHGYGGQDETKVYCRDRYYNNGETLKSFAVLRYPSKESYTKTTEDKESSYDLMQRMYTDITKVYTKKDQTGAVDANGNPLLWPTREEGERSFNQACAGLIWKDWDISYTGDGHAINTGGQIQDNSDRHLSDDIDVTTGEIVDFNDYIGWHKIVLTQATYVEPKEKKDVNDRVERKYVEGGWYTFCIPFDMTEKQVYEYLGVPYSTEQYKNMVGTDEVIKSGESVGDGKINRKLPDIRTLKQVTRKPNPGGTNQVIFYLSDDISDGRYWAINDADPASSAYASCGVNSQGEKIILKGGYPYLIKPYFYLQGTETTKSVSNLGKFVLTRFGDKFDEAASCVHNNKTFEDCGGGVSLTGEGSGKTTMMFAKPFEHHKIQALFDNGAKSPTYALHSNGKKFYYTFIGQFWKQPLPLNSFYMVDGAWYHYTSRQANYYWNAYKCIIMATEEVDDHEAHPNSGLFRDNSTAADGKDHSHYPVVVAGTKDYIEKFLRLVFLDGLDDSEFGTNGARGYQFTFDDDIMECGEDGETTAINNLDGEDILPVTSSSRIYNMAGQYVGNSLDGLSKGMYIVKGKKIVVK